mgnify:CR=1 FL=1
MATYKEIHGVNVQYRDSDATAIEGDVWYNTNGPQLKAFVGRPAWSASASMINGRTLRQGATGTQTAGLAAFGNPAAEIKERENKSNDLNFPKNNIG